MGLLRGVARTAVIAGTASAVSGRVQRRQQGRWAAQEAQNAPAAYAEPQYAAPPPQYAPAPQQYAPPPPAPPPAPAGDDMDAKIAQLRDLAELRDQGVITDAELATQKARILGS